MPINVIKDLKELTPEEYKLRHTYWLGYYNGAEDCKNLGFKHCRELQTQKMEEIAQITIIEEK